jgi:uncharacterized membrane protein YbhN (UPF0104 family)
MNPASPPRYYQSVVARNGGYEYSLAVLERLRASRRVRAALLLVILGCCAFGLNEEWPQVQPWIGRLHVYSLAGSIVAAMAAAGCMMLAWRALLADLGSRLPVLVAARVTFVAQLGKYVPGAVWSFAAHVELGHDYQVPRRRGAASVVVALAVAVAVGLLIAAVALPLSSPTVARRYLVVLLVVPVIAVCLAPPVLHRLLNVALRIIRQEPLDQRISWRGLARALGWTLLGWLLLGLQVWFLLADVAKDGYRSMLLAIGGYALACSVALVLVVFPNGIGARELLLVAALAPVLPGGAALAIALMARVVTTVSDLAWGGIGLAIARRSPAPASARQAADRPAAGRHRKSAGELTAPPEHEPSRGVPEAAA